MNRRHFIGTFAGGGAGVALLKSGLAHKMVKENTSVTWTVKGFSCITCAVGLETILRQQEGITRATATYPSGRVQVGFNSSAIAVQRIKQLVEDAGFEIRD
jgi:copper chaperone CopZ